jgi:hypothetical protein
MVCRQRRCGRRTTLQEAANNLKVAGTIVRILGLKRRIERHPRRSSYVDVALTPVVDDDATLDRLTKIIGAKAAIAHSGADALGAGWYTAARVQHLALRNSA